MNAAEVHQLLDVVGSASFLAELSVSSPRKLFIFVIKISKKIFSGSKYPTNILFNFEKGSTDSRTAGCRLRKAQF